MGGSRSRVKNGRVLVVKIKRMSPWRALQPSEKTAFGWVRSGRVEATVTRRLPHRSGLAAFPHPALLMSNPVSSRASSPDVNEPWGRQRVGAQKSVETIPRHSTLLPAPPYRSMPGSDGLG